MSRRYLALALPCLPLDRLRRLMPELAGQPLGCWASLGSQRLLTAAEGPGLQAGQALADAQAICPGALLLPAAPEEDAALLQRLALWCLRFTPLVALDGEDGLLLDTTGATALFGGEARYLASVAAALRQAGFRLSAALASHAGTAAALARDGSGRDHLLPPGAERAALAPLPLASLRLPQEVLLGLARLGLLRVGEVLRQPRGPLLRRFGPALLDALDDATGERPRPFRSVRPPARFLALRGFLEPILTRPAIEAALDDLLKELCAALQAAGQGARRLELRAERVDRTRQALPLGLGAASREEAHLRRLFAPLLDRLQPDLGFERMALEALLVEPLGARQSGLSGVPEGALAGLLDRLGQRLALQRFQPLDGHWPEYEAVPLPAFEAALPLEEPAAWGQEARPVRLLAEPLPAAPAASPPLAWPPELALPAAPWPPAPPAALRLGRQIFRVISWEGPERLEPEWWGEDAARPARDYYRVQTAEGPRLWLCRLVEPGAGPARWFLHGYLA